MDRGPASFLPEAIREALKRKSTRDPNSRFPAKLHLLLSYTSEWPDFQEMVGIAWANDEEFKMNKPVLADVMGIKLNTLNVNLRDLRYEQVQRHEDGWTRWRRPGFTRLANTIEEEEDLPRELPPVPDFVGRMPLPFALEHVTEEQRENFLTDAQRLWMEILRCSPTAVVPVDFVVDKAAQRFRYRDQPLENAREVIAAILKPAASGERFVFADFGRLLAMFGPAKTIMVKIAALLACSNATGRWLMFERNHSVMGPLAFFHQYVPNCLVVQHSDNSQEKVFNVPVVEAPGDYLVDDFGNRYDGWEAWFGKHPVRGQTSFRYYS
jgi:hypothetical protein